MKKKKLPLLAVLIVVVFIAASLFLRNQLSPEHQVKRKVAKVNKASVSCETVRSDLGSATDYAKYSLGTQKIVLEKQMTCFADDFQYDKAIAAGQKLEAIYAAEHDEARRAQVETILQGMRAAQQQAQAVNSGSGSVNAQQ